MNVQANFKGVSVFKEKYGHFIGGEWVSGATGETIAQYNPATGETLAHIHDNWVEGSVERGTYYPPAGVPYPPDGLPIETRWRYRTAVCPECSKLTIELSPPPEWRPVFEEGELLKTGE